MRIFSQIKLFLREYCLEYLLKTWQIFSIQGIRIYHKFLSLFLRFKKDIHRLEYSSFRVDFIEDALDLPGLKLNRLNPTYVLLKSLVFQPEININRIRDFKSLLKWNALNLDFPVVMRNYPMGFTVNINSCDRPKLALKLPPEVKSINQKDFLIYKDLRTYEEIVTMLPYVRKADKKKIFKVPTIKEPVAKYRFSREEMRLIREKVAQQNKTSWLNIEIYEIYDKFFPNLYHNIRQIPGTKALECHFSRVISTRSPKKDYYLIIGQRKDVSQSIKAIVDPADIKKDKNS